MIVADLLNNILTNYAVLQKDFTGFSINPSGVSDFLFHLFIAGSILFIYYLFGEKLRKSFFSEQKEFTFFISIVLGYITIGAGIALLGTFSLLKPEIILLYLVGIAIVAYYPFAGIPKIKFPTVPYKEFVGWGVLLFVLISFLRLMTPEIVEDGYHTDLPRLYLATQTMMHESREMLHVIPYPQLPEMTYLIALFLGDKESTRVIHFGFYVLIVLLLFEVAQNKATSFVRFAPLVFVTAPLAIRYSPSQYTDFFMLLPFLLSILLIKKNISFRIAILSGILFGAVISTKIWMLIYLPAFLVFIALTNRKEKKKKTFSLISLFTLSAFAVVIIWYLRSYLLTGYPLYPLFVTIEYLEKSTSATPSQSYFGLNWKMFLPQNMAVLSPLFFLGIIFCLTLLKQTFVLLKRFPLALFFLIVSFEQVIIKVDLGRYLFAWFTTGTLVVSSGIYLAFTKSKVVRYGLVGSVIILGLYYVSNTLFILPYGFGWADKNAYLTRVLGRDNVSYYDFNKLFDKHISEKDLVATYGIGSFYYADFAYTDIGYVFGMKDRSFDLLKKKKVTKLLIKGGDIAWFCKTLSLTDCDPKKVALLATYPADMKKYNLYLLK